MKTQSDSFLRELGREKSESYRALYQGLGWFLTVSLAFLAVIGQRLVGPQFEPNAGHLWAMVFVFAMTFRYFSRAMLDCINMQSWSLLFNAYTKVMHADDSERENLGAGFWKLYELYVFQWRSPIRLGKAVRDTIKIGYGYLLLLEAAIFGFVLHRIGACQIFCFPKYWTALVTLVAAVLYELHLLEYSRFQFAAPEDVPAELLSRAARAAQISD